MDDSGTVKRYHSVKYVKDTGVAMSTGYLLMQLHHIYIYIVVFKATRKHLMYILLIRQEQKVVYQNRMTRGT